MRIGTWNLAGRRSDAHLEFITALNCDVLLLTEVRHDVSIPGYDRRLTVDEMAPGRRWAGVFSRIGLAPRPDPHPTSAVAQAGDLVFCSTVLPWRNCGAEHPWSVGSLAEKTNEVLDKLVPCLPDAGLVWGGDWNHALLGPDWSGSRDGRRALLEALSLLNLHTPTADLPHRQSVMRSIDHIAVPLEGQVSGATQVSATVADRYLSDHDAYVVLLDR